MQHIRHFIGMAWRLMNVSDFSFQHTDEDVALPNILSPIIFHWLIAWYAKALHPSKNERMRSNPFSVNFQLHYHHIISIFYAYLVKLCIFLPTLMVTRHTSIMLMRVRKMYQLSLKCLNIEPRWMFMLCRVIPWDSSISFKAASNTRRCCRVCSISAPGTGAWKSAAAVRTESYNFIARHSILHRRRACSMSHDFSSLMGNMMDSAPKPIFLSQVKMIGRQLPCSNRRSISALVFDGYAYEAPAFAPSTNNCLSYHEKTGNKA